jgi:acetoacetate decarboxylase
MGSASTDRDVRPYPMQVHPTTVNQKEVAMPAMPVLAPLYPAPPYEYRGSHLVVALGEGDPLVHVLPPGLDRPAARARTVVFAEYPDTTIGPYREVVVLTAASWHGVDGVFCPLIYVDSDAALCAGREAWGFPKKLADIELFEEGGTVRCRLTRGEQELIVLVGHAAEVTEPSAAAALGVMPIYNHKLIPAANGKETDVDCLTQVHLDVVGHQAWIGTGALRASGEAALVLGDALEVQLMRAVVDSVLLPGERIG